jgi:zinc/manganese transport system permease protein
MTTNPPFTWNLVEDIRQLFEYPFMVNALRAGTLVALVAGLIGWFMVLRRQSFAGHTLAVVSFPGATAAILLGVSASYGYFAFAIGAAIVFAVVAPAGGKRSRSEESAIVGTVQAFALAAGFLFISLSHRNITGAQSILFGSFLGITTAQVAALAASTALVLVILGLIARPLLFASFDPDVATARGVPVRLLSVVFLLLLGVAAAEASQITGALLIFALLVLPAATAERLTSRPGLSVLVTVVIALVVTWLSLALSYYNNYPIGFHITSLAFGAYVLANAWQSMTQRLSPAGRPS